jgi:hypothetical protein
VAAHSNEQTENTEAITKKNQKEISASTSKLWSSIVKNYEMIQGAQLSNSFILLMVLNEAEEPLTTTQISELISKRSKGEIYRVSATLRDSLEHRLKREGYVDGIEVNNKGLYSITPKGQKLLRGWKAFLTAYS